MEQACFVGVSLAELEDVLDSGQDRVDEFRIAGVGFEIAQNHREEQVRREQDQAVSAVGGADTGHETFFGRLAERQRKRTLHEISPAGPRQLLPEFLLHDEIVHPE